eukprot:2756302-Amphidinium_carterae.1
MDAVMIRHLMPAMFSTTPAPPPPPHAMLAQALKRRTPLTTENIIITILVARAVKGRFVIARPKLRHLMRVSTIYDF